MITLPGEYTSGTQQSREQRVQGKATYMNTARLVLEYLEVLMWPVVVLVIVFVFKKSLRMLLNRIQHADFPGGIGIDLGQQVRKTTELSAIVQKEKTEGQREGPSIPLTEANARLMNVGLRPSPSGLDMSYYRTLARQDPNVALAGLRIEIDILARNLAKGFDLPVTERVSGIVLIRQLWNKTALTYDQMQLAVEIVGVCNAAVHGTFISEEEANAVIDSADVLAKQYLDWLAWGFPDGWTPQEQNTS